MGSEAVVAYFKVLSRKIAGS